MTTANFSQLSTKGQMEYLKNTAILIHKIIKGNIIVSLYWSKELVFEVLTPRNRAQNIEIKCYDRFEYVES